MKTNLVPFPKPPAPEPHPGPDFEQWHYVIEERGKRFALDIFGRVTDLSRDPAPTPALPKAGLLPKERNPQKTSLKENRRSTKRGGA
jgi:hypothetical protein